MGTSFKFEEVVCVVCKKNFFKYKKRYKAGIKTKQIRPCHSITCSMECSKLHTIQYQRMRSGELQKKRWANRAR